MEFLDLILKLCKLSGRYNNSKIAYNSSNGPGLNVVMSLESLAGEIRQKILPKNNSKFTVEISKGQGKVPKIFWVSILPNGRGPSNAASVTICFGKSGEGIVAGLMVPKAGGLHDLVVKNRELEKIQVNINGENESSKYNNCFVNPKEWTNETMCLKEIQKHLKISLNLLSDLIDDGKAGYAYFKN